MSPRTPLPQTIQIYLPQGDPAGIRMAEITTRTVRVFEVPRPLLRDFRDMPESKQVAVYFLFGSSSSGLPSCYIGQTGSVGDRIKQHSDKKDFWDRALFFRESGTDARARPTTEGLLVLAGSVGKAIARPSLSASLARRRVDLVEQGIAEVRGEDYVFVKDHLFSSPSTAGAIVVGGNINGRITWKTADGRTFQQLEDQALSA
jgi:hypothetical protein